MRASLDTQVFEKIDAYRRWRSTLVDDGSGRPLVGLVPTMGALHEGHATLVRTARACCQYVVVSIFVNPLQFGPNEDFDRYPRTFANDVKLCAEQQVDAVFHPGVQEIYPRALDEMTQVVPPRQLVERLCGLVRPGHFQGVATIVLKLLAITQPSSAFFGEKDYQQLTIIKRMVADLDLPVSIVGVPTVREPDGLALSSRNLYLSAEQRQLAPQLQRCLQSVVEASLGRQLTLAQAIDRARQSLASSGFAVQYLEACDSESLQVLAEARRPMVVLVAAQLGSVRLIDNVVCR